MPLPASPGRRLSGPGARGRSWLPPVGDELGQLAQPLQIERMRDRTGRGRDGSRAVRVTESNRGVAAVRQANDDGRVSAVPNADDGQLLSAERMMGTGDRHR